MNCISFLIRSYSVLRKSSDLIILVTATIKILIQSKKVHTIETACITFVYPNKMLIFTKIITTDIFLP